MTTEQSNVTEKEGGRETCHPHSTKEYTEWMAGVWKKNMENQNEFLYDPDKERLEKSARELAKKMFKEGTFTRYKQTQKLFGKK